MATTIGIGLAIAFAYFGTPLPTTLEAKRAASAWLPGVWPSGSRFWPVFFELFQDLYGPFSWIFLILGSAGQFFLWQTGRSAQVLVLFAAGVIVAYPILGVTFFPWYGVPVVVALVHGTFACLARLRLRSRSEAHSPSAGHRVVLLAALGLTFAVGFRSFDLLHRYEDPRYLQAYREAGRWLRGNTPPDATVTFYEIGAVGFESKRRTQDLLGLVSPEQIPFVASGDLSGGLRTHPTDYVLNYSPRQVVNFVDRDWFRAAYEAVAQIPDGLGDGVEIFRLRGEAPITKGGSENPDY